jgi:hypothetical protein
VGNTSADIHFFLHRRMQLRQVSVDFCGVVFDDDFSRNVSDFGEVEHSLSPVAGTPLDTT